MESWAKSQEFAELVLDTSPALAAARAFYESNGFTWCARATVVLEAVSFELPCYRKTLSDR